MFKALCVIATLLGAFACMMVQHVIVRFDKVEQGYKEWSQAISDDCNAAIDCRYSLIMDAVRKDLEEILHKVKSEPVSDLESESEPDSDIAQYIEENEIKIND